MTSSGLERASSGPRVGLEWASSGLGRLRAASSDRVPMRCDPGRRAIDPARSKCEDGGMNRALPADRDALLRTALRLEWGTVAWNVVEGVIAVWAGLLAGSVALLGFGLDSFVETFSGTVMLWRLVSERRRPDDLEAIERTERRAERLVAVSLVLLAAYVTGDAAWTLWRQSRPEPSPVGLALTAVSLVVMWWLARAKRRTALALGSRALESDAFQTTACWWLSLVTLAGMGLNAALGWWWADPVAALGVAALVLVEARSAWRGEECCGSCH